MKMTVCLPRLLFLFCVGKMPGFLREAGKLDGWVFWVETRQRASRRVNCKNCFEGVFLRGCFLPSKPVTARVLLNWRAAQTALYLWLLTLS